MKLRYWILLLASHSGIGVVGFALGLYLLPILIAPSAPAEAEVEQRAAQAEYRAEFHRDLKDSDAFHWGEGQVAIGKDVVSFMGQLAPGPDYKLYLSPEFVETEVDFMRLKPVMQRVGNVDTFDNFIVPLTPSVDPSKFKAVIVWCESFGEFITAAQYRD